MSLLLCNAVKVREVARSDLDHAIRLFLDGVVHPGWVELRNELL